MEDLTKNFDTIGGDNVPIDLPRKLVESYFYGSNEQHKNWAKSHEFKVLKPENVVLFYKNVTRKIVNREFNTFYLDHSKPFHLFSGKKMYRLNILDTKITPEQLHFLENYPYKDNNNLSIFSAQNMLDPQKFPVKTIIEEWNLPSYLKTLTFSQEIWDHYELMSGL